MTQISADIEVRNSTRTVGQWFDGDISALHVGESIGADAMQGADDRWPVYQGDERVGTLFADATGTTYDAVDDDGLTIL